MKTFLSQRIRGNMPFMLALLVIALLAGFTAPLVAYRPGRTTARDFMAFWASARLLRANAAPYNQYQILELEEDEGWTFGLGQPTRYPPWILPVFIPFSFLSLRDASMAWFTFSLIFYILGSYALYSYYMNSYKYIWLFLLAFMIYFPVIIALREGQISALLLVALAGFLWAQYKYKDYLAGMCLAVLAIKPQIMIVFGLVVIFWIFKFKRWRVLVGAVVLALAGTVFTLALSPQTILSFLASLNHLPWRYPTPTLVAWIRAVFLDWKYDQLTLIPLLIILPCVRDLGIP